MGEEETKQAAPTGVTNPTPAEGTPTGVVKPTPVASTPSSGSGGLNGPFPQELAKWNWGAFFLSWIWGIGHSVWIALLALIGPLGLIMMFVLGVKGNEWAWQYRKFESVDQFKAVQKAWAKWGVILFILELVLLGIIIAIVIAAAASTAISPTDYKF